MKIFRHFSANEEFLDYFPFKRELSMEAYILENESILKLDDNLFNEVDVLGSEISIKDGQVTKNKDEYRLTRKDPVGHVFHVPSKYYEKEISK